MPLVYRASDLIFMAKIQEFLFTTTKAADFGAESEINVVCKTCKESVSFIGTFETIFDNRRKWIESHSCDILVVNQCPGIAG